MDYKPHEQWDERNFRFQSKDMHPNIPFGYNTQYRETMREGIGYTVVLLALLGAVIWVL